MALTGDCNIFNVIAQTLFLQFKYILNDQLPVGKSQYIQPGFE